MPPTTELERLVNMKLLGLCFLVPLLQVSKAYPYDPSSLSRNNLMKRDVQPVAKWTTTGNLYASGIEARRQDPNDYFAGCFRFPLAYPPIIQSGPQSFQPNPLKFSSDACRGNKLQQILDKEFLDEPKFDWRYGTRSPWEVAPEFTTITMGGNDVNILSLIKACIYSLQLWGKTCEEHIQASFDTLYSEDFKSKSREVIQTALTKGSCHLCRIWLQIFHHRIQLDSSIRR